MNEREVLGWMRACSGVLSTDHADADPFWVARSYQAELQKDREE